MTEQELRALVREAIARHAGSAGPTPVPSQAAGGLQASASFARLHPSHGMFFVPSGGDADGPCLIEPAVMCNHCGYCKSYGH